MSENTAQALWLDRFERPTPLRRTGRFFMYRALASGAPRVVAVARPELDPADAEQLIEQAIAIHGLLDHPAVPRVAAHGTHRDTVWLAFDCDAVCDLEGLLANLGDPLPRHLPVDASAEILRMAAGVLEALGDAGHIAGRLSTAQIIIGPAGQLSLIGPGCEFMAHQGPAVARRFESPEYAAMRDGRRRLDGVADVYLVGALARALVAVEAPRREMTRLRLAEADADRAALADWRALTARDPDERAPDGAAAADIIERLWPEPTGGSGLRALVQPLTPATATAGAVIAGRYRLERRLGFGRRGAWFVGWDGHLEQPVAIKWLDDGGTEAERARILREVNLLRSLRHPNVMAGFDVLIGNGRIGAVVEYVPGDPLGEMLRSEVARHPLAASLVGIADALDYLGRRGVVHRDVKPGNIICHEEREAVLVDLGLARTTGGGGRPVTHPDERLGTYRYMAPEALTGPAVGPSADVYSFCMVLMDVLVQPPVENHPTPAEALARLEAAEVPQLLARLIADGVSSDPTERPAPGRLAAGLRALEPPSGVGALVMAADGRWFSIDGRVVDLRRRGSLRRILAVLGRAHRQRNLEVLDLQHAGWPDERMQPQSGAARVYTAVSTLRREGLKGLLERVDDGYRLAPTLVVRRVDVDTAPPRPGR